MSNTRAHWAGENAIVSQKTVDGVDESLGRQRRQHDVTHQRDVAIPVALGFGRECVGAEEARMHRDVAQRGEAPGRDQHLALALEIEPVTRLDVDARDAFGQQGVEAGQRARHELFHAGGPRGLDARQDTAAGPRDLLVGGAPKPHLELVGAMAAEDEVGMTIDEAGRHEAAAAVDHQIGIAPGRQVAIRTHEGDPSVARRDGAVLDDPEAGTRRIQRRDPGASPQSVHSGLVGHARLRDGSAEPSIRQTPSDPPPCTSFFSSRR